MRKEGLAWLFVCLVLIYLPSVSAASPYLSESSAWQGNLTPTAFASNSFGDIDNDGDLDLVLDGYLSGGHFAKIYLNNGSTFTESSSWQFNLTRVNYGSHNLGDIDNDGDLDLVMSGCSDGGGSINSACNDGGYMTYIYLNNGSTFTESSSWQDNLTKSWKGSHALGDIDNDGDLDLVMSGSSQIGKIAKIYINNGTSFIENTTEDSGGSACIP